MKTYKMEVNNRKLTVMAHDPDAAQKKVVAMLKLEPPYEIHIEEMITRLPTRNPDHPPEYKSADKKG